MENYSKGKNVETPLTRESIPIPNLPSKFSWMQVTGGSKMRNLLNFAEKALDEDGVIVWSASGGAVPKTISCVEILKRKNRLHQISKICYRSIEEHWEPKVEGLDPLIVTRQIPTIHVLLSKALLDHNELGYQPPILVENTSKQTFQEKRGVHKIRSTSNRKRNCK